jgi:cytoskeletal protein CcmA (bactofilin family)
VLNDISDFEKFKSPDLFNESAVSTELKMESWGVFTLSHATSDWRDRSYSKTALLGNYLFDSEKVGLYLADKGKYLSIAGKTKLTGTTYLPALGIRSVYIDGEPYRGDKLFYGREENSNKNLPELNPDKLKIIEQLFTGELGDSIGDLSDLLYGDKVSQSFAEQSILYESRSEIDLINVSITGKLIIHSDSLIYVNKSSQINNCILVAPQIIIDKGFRGSLQVFASDSILIEENVELSYPSVIGVYNPEGNTAFCYVNENAEISGAVFCHAALEAGESTELFLQPGVSINGLVYASGKVHIQGSIYGTLYANTFVLRTKRGYYENHLLNAVVDPETQYRDFLVPGMLEEHNQKAVLAWY